MALVTNSLAMFPGAVASVTYDDATLNITAVGVVNNSAVDVTCTVKKLTKPARTYTHTWIPGDSTSFSVPAGVKFTLDATDGNLTMPGIELFVRYG